MIPGHLLRRKRPPDDSFDGDERLFRACSAEMLEPQTRRFTPENIPFDHNSVSVNRERYSRPEDVLLGDGRGGFGVVAFLVRAVPTEEWTPEGKGAATYRLQIKHDPIEENYAHSEIRLLKNGSFDRRAKIRTPHKQIFRQRLSNVSRLVLAPSN